MFRKLFLTSSLFFVVANYAQAQETRDYLSNHEQYVEAVQLYKVSNYPAAYHLFGNFLDLKKQQISVFPNEKQINARLYQSLAAIYSGKQNGITMVEDFLNDYPNHPNTSEAQLQVASYLFKNRNFNSALTQLQKIDQTTLSKEQLDLYNVSIGYTYFIKKKFRKAESHLSKVAKGNSIHKPEAKYYLALSHFFQKEYKKALKGFNELMVYKRYSSDVPLFKAQILFNQGKYQEVIDYVEPLLNDKAIQGSAEINQVLGQSYYNLQQYQKALPFLEEYSKRAKGQSPEAQYQLATTQYQLRDYQKAVKSFEKLNIVDDEIGQHALYAMADTHLKLGLKEKAKNGFSRAGKMEYNSVIQEIALFNEAKLSYELGRNSEALSLTKQFIDDYPNSKFKTEADEILVDLFLTSNNYKDAYSILKSIKSRSSKLKEAYQKVAYFRAVEFYNNDDYKQAKPLFDEVISHPIDARYVALANYWLGEMAYEVNRYQLSLDYLKKFINASIQKPQQYIDQANYTVGYAYYKQKNYKNALSHFQKVQGQSQFYLDAKLRLADSQFALRKLTSAKQNYELVAKSNQIESDYANYQVAILKGLNGQTAEKVSMLRSIFTNNTKSAYADDALFEYGRVFVTQENYPSAKQSFLTLLKEYPKSGQIANTYSQLGLIEYNQKNYTTAIDYYDKVVKDYPNTEEASVALSTIQEIYIEMGQPDAYFAYLKNVKGVSIDDREQEKIIYQAAESQFKNADCEKATKGFTNYLSKYPSGVYAANAHFYSGECFNQTGQADEAIQQYKLVTQLQTNKFTERSLIRVARYYYRNKQWQNSADTFSKLLTLQNNAESIYKDEVNIGLMQCYNQLRLWNKALPFAEYVLTKQRLNTLLFAEATFVLGVNQYLESDYLNARSSFNQVVSKSTNTFGAESRYLLAKMLYNEALYKKSIEAAYKVSDETPSEDDFVAKSFILIADNYVKLNELFQAKATLDSVLENYTGGDSSILVEAKRKRDEIENQQKSKSNILNQSGELNNQLQLQDNE